MKRFISTTCLLLMVFAFAAAECGAQTFPVTIQGSLKDGSAPANGIYDIKCTLHSAETNSPPLVTLTFPSVQVTNGIFSVAISDGLGIFTNPMAPTWVEYSVRPGASAVAYTTLSPRQRVSFAPYAVNSVNAAALGGTFASDFVQTSDPRMTDARNPLPGNANYVQNTTTQQPGNFNISGTGTANVFSANQFSLSGFKMLSNGGLLDNLYLGLNSGQSTTGSGNAFFGTNSGRDSTTAVGNAFFGWYSGAKNISGGDNAFFGGAAGGSNTTASNNSFFGRLAGSATISGGNNSAFGFESLFLNSAGVNNSTFGFSAGINTTGSRNTFIGASSGPSSTTESNNTLVGNQADISAGITNATAIGNLAKVAQSNSLVLGSINGVNGATTDTNVGIGTTTPVNKLHVNGNVRITNGALYITNPNTVVITSPNGACWGITVNNTGALATFPVAPCP